MTISDEAINDVTARAHAIYNDRLKAVLEPNHNDEYVVIHVDSDDY